MDKSEQAVLDMESIDLRAIFNILQKWKWLIVGITVLAVVTSAILSFFVLTPIYQSKTVVMVKQYQDTRAVQGQVNQDDLQSVVDSLSRLPQMTIKTYVGQMKNEALLRTVIDSLKLDKNVYTPGALSGMINVTPIAETNLIELTVKHSDPKLAADIANTSAEKFVEFIGSSNEKQLVLSAEFLTKQLADKEKELTEANKKLNDLRNQERNVPYLQQEAANNNQSLLRYNDQLIQAEIEYQQVLAGKTVAEEKLNITPEKIKVQKFDSALSKQIETEEINPMFSELSSLVAQKNVELAQLGARKYSFEDIVAQLQFELQDLQVELNGKSEEDRQLQEKVEQIKKTRDVLAEKLTQVEIIKSINLSQTNLQIVTPAFPPNGPVSPKKMMNIAIAMILGLMISVGTALILEFLNNKINRPEDINQHLGMPILGTIPLAKETDFE